MENDFKDKIELFHQCLMHIDEVKKIQPLDAFIDENDIEKTNYDCHKREEDLYIYNFIRTNLTGKSSEEYEFRSILTDMYNAI